MTTESNNTFICPNCNKKYKWQDSLSGHKVKCSCGSLLIVNKNGKDIDVHLANNQNNKSDDFKQNNKAPKQEPQTYELSEDPDDDIAHKSIAPKNKNKQTNMSVGDLYELDSIDETKSSAPTSNTNKQGANKAKSTSLPKDKIGAGAKDDDKDKDKTPEEPAYVNAAVAAARREEDRKKWANQQALAEHRKLNVVWPSALLAIGVFIILIASFVVQLVSGKSGLLALVVIGGLEIFIMTPLLILALYISDSILKLGFGNIHTAIFKAIAINTGPGALADVISIPLVVLATVGFLGLMAGPFIVYLILIGIPLSKMFELDFQETAVTIIIIIALRLAAFLLIFMNIYSMIFSGSN